MLINICQKERFVWQMADVERALESGLPDATAWALNALTIMSSSQPPLDLARRPALLPALLGKQQKQI